MGRLAAVGYAFSVPHEATSRTPLSEAGTVARKCDHECVGVVNSGACGCGGWVRWNLKVSAIKLAFRRTRPRPAAKNRTDTSDATDG